jgi:N-acyl-D-amino-acid deacylase
MLGLLRRHRIPGGSLSLAKDGRPVYARGFGWARLEPKVIAKAEMMFGLASVSKAITAVAVLKLVDAGRLGLDDGAFAILRELWPPNERARLDPRARAITVRMLLNHSAGYTKQPQPPQVSRQLGLPVSQLREEHLVRWESGQT